MQEKIQCSDSKQGLELLWSHLQSIVNKKQSIYREMKERNVVLGFQW